jgi:hypothetical protein
MTEDRLLPPPPSVRENFKRPYGARDNLPVFEALNAPGYYQEPLCRPSGAVFTSPLSPAACAPSTSSGQAVGFIVAPLRG